MVAPFFSRLLYAKSAALAVAAFVGFSCGLLFAALFFPARVEVVEVEIPVIETAPIDTPAATREISQPAAPDAFYRPVIMTNLPGWNQEALTQALPAFRNACVAFSKLDDSEPVAPAGLAGTAGDWKPACVALSLEQLQTDEDIQTYLQTHYAAYAVETSEGAEGTFTGYYETTLRGSLTPTETFNVPLFALPKDLVELDSPAFGLANAVPSVIGQVNNRRLIPYDTRSTIEDSPKFYGRADVIVWVDDWVDAHLLHIQGSGRVLLPDGSVRRIGYAGNNGHRFRGIGSILLNAGELGAGQGSMPSVADWLRRNPNEGRRYMQENPRFIFFRWIEGPGPIGALGVPLPPRRSLAVDPRFIPFGAPLWLDVKDPDGVILDRLVVALDTGSAIRGAVRGDFFWGGGEGAFDKAGRMKSTGRYFLFLPNTITAPPHLSVNSL